MGRIIGKYLDEFVSQLFAGSKMLMRTRRMLQAAGWSPRIWHIPENILPVDLVANEATFLGMRSLRKGRRYGS